MIFDRHRYDVRWRFVNAPGKDEEAWHWEIWTPSGVLVVRSNAIFNTLSACEQDAVRHGYSPVHPAGYPRSVRADLHEH